MDNKCEECDMITPDKDLTNIMVGTPIEIIAVCPECLERLKAE